MVEDEGDSNAEMSKALIVDGWLLGKKMLEIGVKNIWGVREQIWEYG